MSKLNKLASLVFLLLILQIVQAASIQNDPVALLQHVANNMIAQLRVNKATLKTHPRLVYDLAYRYVVPYADLPEMSKHVLPPLIWNNASSSDRMRFQKLFTRILIRTYASALAAYQDQTIQFFPLRGSYQHLKTVEVKSEILGRGNQPISVTYRLVRVGGAWRLFDLSVEGVSMLESFRSQFSDILAHGNMQQLLARMTRHNAR